MKSEYQGAAMSRSIYTFLSRLVVLGVAVSLCACTSVKSENVISDDGSWTKSVVINVGQMELADKPTQLDMASMIHFDSPGWKVVVKDDNGDHILTATKTFQPGDKAGFSLFNGKDEYAHSESEAKDGLYYDIWSWRGPSPSASMKGAHDVISKVLSAHTTVKGDELNKLVKNTFGDFWTVIYGPNDPVMAYIGHEEMAMRMFRTNIFRLLTQRFGEAGISNPETKAREVIPPLIKELEALGKDKSNPTTINSEESPESVQGASIEVSVRANGKSASEHNGVIDPVEGSVHWSFYTQATAPGPVTLNAKFGE